MSAEARPIDWRHALLVMLICHGTSTLLLRLVPTIAPEIVAQYGWSASFVGWIATAANLGSTLLVAGGVGLLRAVGSIRAIRLGLIASGLGVLAIILPIPALALAAGLVVGIGHGPTNPAGNDILQRHAPAGAQALLFSIKQSAVPLGGVLGGLLLPVLAQTYGVSAALVFGCALALLALMATAPLQRRSRTPVSMHALSTAFSVENLSGPLRTVLSIDALRALWVSGFLLAFNQSVWFVYLTSFLVFGLGYSPTTAGVLYAVMQGTSIAGRLALGWAADRIGSGMPLLVLSLVAATLSTMALAATVLIGPGPVAVAIVTVSGITAAGWNGVQVAETVRLSPKDRLYEAVSGVTLGVGIGVVCGPLVVSVLLDMGFGWGVILAAISVLPLAGLRATLRQVGRERIANLNQA